MLLQRGKWFTLLDLMIDLVSMVFFFGSTRFQLPRSKANQIHFAKPEATYHPG